MSAEEPPLDLSEKVLNIHESMSGPAVRATENLPLGICCHSADVCFASIARELGVIVINAFERRLDAPMNVKANVICAGCANEQIRRQLEPLLRAALWRRVWM